jgi:hypothetical protein
MTRTRKTLSCDADADAADAPDAPPAAGKGSIDDDYNLPNGEEEDEIDALIRTGMIVMYIRVLGLN